MNEKTTPEDRISPNPNRTLFIVLGIAAGAIILIFIVVAIVFALLDPFNIVGRLTGRYDPIASALPPDSPVILSMDFAKLQSKESKRIIDVFKDAAEAADIEDTADLIEELDDSLSESLDITFTDDILPWVGQFAGMSMPSFDLTSYDMPAADVIFLIEVRNRRKADDFIQTIVNNLTEEMDQEIDQTEYRGATIYDAQGTYEFDSFVFTRFDNLLLIATDVELVKDSIDASKGESYADTEKYDEIISSLPKERVITMLFDSNLISSLQGDLLEGLDVYQQVDLFRWIGASISAVDSGIQMDYVIAYDRENLTDNQLEMMESELKESTLASYFPKETFFYFTGERLDLIWETFRENSYQLTDTDDFDESMELLSEEIGFNPDKDFFPLLDGGWSIGLLHTQAGYLAEDMQIPLGLLLLIESNDDAAMVNLLDKVSGLIEETGLGLVNRVEANGFTLFDLEDPYMDAVILSFGGGEGLLMIGTDQDTIGEILSRGETLLDNERYNQSWEALPDDTHPVLFFDLSTLYEILEDEFFALDDSDALSSLDIFRPMHSIVAGSAPVDDGVIRSTIILLIEGGE